MNINFDDLKESLLLYRRYLHENPELSFSEHNTTKFIIQALKSFGGFEIQRFSDTGVVANLKTKNKTKTIAFRADIDALALHELTNLSFQSKNQGVMHACGHDAHSAILLTLAKVLSKNIDKINANIKLIFQRGEEIAPGGAKELVQKGALDGVDMIFALHVMPGQKSGSIAIKQGVASANKDTFDILVQGMGGHSSMPQFCSDPILIASQIVVNLQSIISRNVDPFNTAVLSIASFISGSPYGVIPDSATLTGAIRTFDSQTQKLVKKRMRKIVKKIAYAYDAKAKVQFNDSDYTAINNDIKISKELEKLVVEKFGVENLIKEKHAKSFSEDFSEYQKVAKGCMVWLGVGGENDKNQTLHSPYFNLDEEALMVGVRLFYYIIQRFADE